MNPDSKRKRVAPRNLSVMHHLLNGDSAKQCVEGALKLDQECVPDCLDFPSSVTGEQWLDELPMFFQKTHGFRLVSLR
jgi:hypothetical protein